MIDAIVLAAGQGARMGQVKPLVRIAGEAALAIVIRRLRAAGIDRPIVVLGRQVETVRATVDLSECRLVRNPDPERGLASSLLLGIRAVASDARGAVVLHADMPAVSVETIRLVLDAATPDAQIAAPRYRGRRGFPVYLSRACFRELEETLAGDSGARDYIERHRGRTRLIEVGDAGCVLDFDTPEDLADVERTASCGTFA
jgi:molybdenum cofactor cytidylyltransferase